MTQGKSSRSSRKLTPTCPSADQRLRQGSATSRSEHGTILYVPVVLIIAVLAIVAVAVFVAVGHGGQLSMERTDHAPLELGPVSATDVVLLRPPTALWGYNVQATDDAMEQIAESIRERDVRIVALEQLVTDLSREPVTGRHAAPPAVSSYREPPAARPYTDLSPVSSAPGSSAASSDDGLTAAGPDADPPAASPDVARGGPEAGQPASDGSPAPPERSHD
jgi:hypothetical protein